MVSALCSWMWLSVLSGRRSAVLPRVKHLTISVLHVPCCTRPLQHAMADGCLTRVAPDLESIEIHRCTCAAADVAVALAGHTALASLTLHGDNAMFGPSHMPWQAQALPSISRLTRLVLKDLSEAVAVPGLLHDIAACAALRELHLSPDLGWFTWAELGEECRQQLVALRGKQGMRRCTIDGIPAGE